MKECDKHHFAAGFRLAVALLESEQPKLVLDKIYATLYVGWQLENPRYQLVMTAAAANLNSLIEAIIQEVASGTA